MSPGLFDDSKPASVLAKGQFPGAALAEPAPGSTDEEISVARDGDQVIIRKRNKDGSYSTVRRSVKEGLDPELDQHFLKGDFKATIDAAAKRLEQNPHDRSALWHKAESHAMLEQHDEAIELYDKLLELDPNDASVINNKAISLSAKGEHAEAHRLFARAYEIDPKSSIIAGNLAGSHLDRGEHDKAFEMIKKARALGAVDADHQKQLDAIYNTLLAIQNAPKLNEPAVS